MSFSKGFRNALIPSLALWGLLGWGVHAAFGQSVQQFGPVTPNTAAIWNGTGVIKGGVTATDSPLTTFGVTRDAADAICISSARATAPGRNQLCFHAATAGPAKISLQNYGTATAQSFQFVVNGVTQGFPTVGSLPVIANGFVCFANTSGILQDCSIGTGVSAALGVNVGTAGAFVVNGGVLGTPISGTLTNAVGLPISTGLTGVGINVLAALGINVGTAGAFVVNGGALGSPTSAGTLPAFTLGGTIAGGGNQINNIVVGNVTPLAGTFTTLVAGTQINTPILAPTSDGTTNLRINNFAQTHNIVTIDTTNFRVGINKTPGAFDLDVAGAVNFASTLAVTGHVTLEGVTSTAATGTGALVFGTAPTITLTNATGLPTTSLTGTLQAAQEPAHTGDVTNSAGSLALAVAANAITFAKIQQISANSVMSNWSGSTANATANTFPSCADTSGNHLNYVNGTGITCGTSVAPAFVGFSANKNGSDQTGVVDATSTPITFGTEDYDVGSHFASNAWTPPAGKVHVICGFYATGTIAVDSLVQVSIYKDAAPYKTSNLFAGTNQATAYIAVDDSASGSNVYTCNGYVDVISGTATFNGTVTLTFFQGHVIN